MSKTITKLTITSFVCLVAFGICLNGCKKFVEVDVPATRITKDNIFTNDITAIAALTGIYGRIGNGSPSVFSMTLISKMAGLSSDELSLWSGADLQHSAYYKNSLSATTGSSAGHEFWDFLYPRILDCNAAIDGLNSSESLTPGVKQQLLGEAKFMRAFFYFYLVNLYGELPLVLGIDPEVNRLLGKSPVAIVYQSIVNDLKEAQNLLSTAYLDVTLKPYVSSVVAEKVRPTKWAATALLARVYLYIGDYVNAETEAGSVINNTSMFSLPNLSSVFLKNSDESIWQIQPVLTGWNTDQARMFNLSAVPTGLSSTKPVYLSNDLYLAFEAGDNRATNWIGNLIIGTDNYYFPFKYKQATQDATINSAAKMTEYVVVLRLAEQYLIRAEARAQLDKIDESQSDLNAIRTRANLDNTTANDKASLLDAILHERRVELFAEWGHRWFDLKRTDKVNIVMEVTAPSIKGGSWEITDRLYPIPLTDIQRNPNLVQNDGYK